MTTHRKIACFTLAASVALAACQEAPPSGVDLAQVGPGTIAAQRNAVDPALCDPTAGGFASTSTNPWFPMLAGDQWSYAGEEDGVPVTLLITVLGLTRTIEGVSTRVVEEREWEDGELLEVSWNYIAQAGDGTICYFGEDVDIYEEGGGISHDGAWCADEPSNAPGILMPAEPRPGLEFPLEIAPGVAEDMARIVGAGPTSVVAGRFDETIRFRETNPLDGDVGYKVFASGAGMIVDGPLELLSFTAGAPAPGAPVPTDPVCGS